MERTEQEELRILRRVMAHKQAKSSKKPIVRVESKMNGLMMNYIVTIILYEVPSPESILPDNITEITSLAIRRAQEHATKLGYSQVLGVRYNGKAWEARLKI